MNDDHRLPVLVHSVSRLRRLLPVLLIRSWTDPHHDEEE